MNKFLKILLIVIFVILLLITGAFLLISSYLTPQNLRNIVTQISSETLKHPVKIGAVHLHFGLRIGIRIDDISLPNVKGFSPGPMLEINRIFLNLRLFPLLQHKIDIDQIELINAKIKLEKNQVGKLNFSAIIPKKASGSNWALSLSSIDLKKSEIHYIDPNAKLNIHLKDFTQHISFNRNNIKVSGNQTLYLLKTKSLPEMVIKINNQISYDTLKKNILIKKITAEYSPISFKISGTVENAELLNLDAELKVAELGELLPLLPSNSRPQTLKGRLKADLSVLGTIKEPKLDGRCELKNISLLLKDAQRPIEKIHGSLSFDQNGLRNIIIQGMINQAKFDVAGSVTNFKNPLLDIIVKLNGNLKDLQAMTAALKEIKMAGPFMIKLAIKGTTKNPAYFGEFNLRGGKIDGIGLTKSIDNLYVRGNIHNNSARIKECSGHIGRSDFLFSGYLTNFKKPVIQIDNRSNTIDLDELLPPPSKKSKKVTGKPIPLTIQGKVRINKLTGMDMEFQNINTDFTFENGVIDIRNCSANTFDGNVKLDFYYDSKSPEPYRINTRMTSLSARKILKRFLKFDKLTGRLTGMGNFQGRGFARNQIISGLSASGNLKFTNGTFKNFEFLNQMLAWLGIKNYKNLRFKDLVCYFKIDHGKAQVKDWALSSAVGDFLSNGTIGLNGNINLKISATLTKKYSSIVKKYHGDWLFYFDKKGRAIIDMDVTGKLNSPRFRLDRNRIKKRLKGKIKDEFNKKKKEWENKLKKQLRGGK